MDCFKGCSYVPFQDTKQLWVRDHPPVFFSHVPSTLPLYDPFKTSYDPLLYPFWMSFRCDGSQAKL